MTKSIRTLALVASIACSALAPAAAATLVVDTDGTLTGLKGSLMGARGVNVGGMLFDVTLYDGSCSGYYINCNPALFSFHDKASADLASAALLSQMLVDGPQGQFDSKPELSFGCNRDCDVFTAYAAGPSNSWVSVSAAHNSAQESSDGIGGVANLFATAFLQQQNNMVYAVWSPAAAVPEPAGFGLMAAGLGLLALALARTRGRAGGHR